MSYKSAIIKQGHSGLLLQNGHFSIQTCLGFCKGQVFETPSVHLPNRSKPPNDQVAINGYHVCISSLAVYLIFHGLQASEIPSVHAPSSSSLPITKLGHSDLLLPKLKAYLVFKRGQYSCRLS